MPDAEEDKPAPDLDELLELLGEPDDAPRRKAVPGSVWLMLALVLSMAGIGLALRTATGTVAAKAAGAPLLPTKASDRTPRDENAETVDVVEDYLARCRKGMTVREVRWIVEDFQKAGLDEGPGSLFMQLGELFKRRTGIDDRKLEETTAAQMKALALQLADHQRAWYGGALADGLRLTESQRAVLRERMAIPLAEDRVTFENRLKAFSLFLDLNFESPDITEESEEKVDEINRLAGGFFSHEMFEELTYWDFVGQGNWLKREEYAPWELCELTSEQLEITRFGAVEAERKRIKEHYGAAEEPPAWCDLILTEEDQELAASTPEFLQRVAAILPVKPEQHFAEGEQDLLKMAQTMHPAQLKLFLLVQPDLAAELQSALEKAGE